jgi:two-component system response regulator HydG
MTDAHKPRMLIVDDEEGMRKTLRRIMVAKGFDVQVAIDGHQAISLAETFQPEILLMDVRMPGLNGVEAYREIKVNCPDAVAIFMTAYSTSELSQEAIDEGAMDVLAKPLDVDNLCDLIRRSSLSRPLLIVDDDPGFRTSLKRALTAAGFHVYTAVGLEEALAEFQRHPRCVALLDMKLNGHSGLQVLQQMRQLNQDVVAVLMTGYPDLQLEMQSGLEVGACCTFVKPFDVDSLVATIRSQKC